jgi:methionyl-tRNA formyltransferase
VTARIAIATPHARYLELVRNLRERHRMEVLHLTSREALTQQALADFAPDYVFFPHWSWKIAPDIYENFEAIIFHMTDLPYGRGGSPLQNLIRRGAQDTKLSAIRCVEALDAGPIYLKRPLSLHGTAEEIFLRASRLMEDMIVEIVTERIEPVEQTGEPETFKRLTPADSNIEDARSLEEVFDRIRMLDADGYPPAFLKAGPYRLEFSRASLKPGELIADVRIRLDDGE